MEAPEQFLHCCDTVPSMLKTCRPFPLLVCCPCDSYLMWPGTESRQRLLHFAGESEKTAAHIRVSYSFTSTCQFMINLCEQTVHRSHAVSLRSPRFQRFFVPVAHEISYDKGYYYYLRKYYSIFMMSQRIDRQVFNKPDTDYNQSWKQSINIYFR